MSHILDTFDFQPVYLFLQKYGLEYKKEFCEKTFIRMCDDAPENPSFANNCSVRKIIEKSVKYLLKHEPSNVLCGGQQKARDMPQINSLENYHLNFSLKYLQYKDWSLFFKLIGNDLTEFVLKKCTIVQKIKDDLVMVVGSLRSFYAQNSRTSNYLLRDVLFYKIVNIKKI
ncbi:Telomerase catalytic subunit/reverse transcriptase TERT, partial [Pseudoloma neurophilia]